MDNGLEERKRLIHAESLLDGGIQKQARRSRRGVEERGEDAQLLVRVSLVFMVISVGIVLLAVVLFFRNAPRASSSGGASVFVPGLNGGMAGEPANDTMESLDPEAAARIVRSALRNRDPKRVETFFILGSSAQSPEEAIALLGRLEKADGLPEVIEPIGSRLISGILAEEVAVLSGVEERKSSRLAQLFLVNGNWRIDLDSYSRHAEPGWGEILARKCDVATVRVFVTEDNYYIGDLYAEALWKCYALVSPDTDEIMFGYAARGSGEEKALDRIVAQEGNIHKATLILKIKEQQGRGQFEISRVLGDDWSVVGMEAGESF